MREVTEGQLTQAQIDDLDKLSGVEFETLCRDLLLKMGFREVKTTETTGDGGIDLIAQHDSPIIGGKFIVQCKRYSGSVGVPIIRDLYGVVSAERANKGILITTGTFTSAASGFAEGKNLELIDGSALRRLMSEYELKSSSVTKTASFMEYECFNRDRYELYLETISERPNDVSEHERLVHFLGRYLISSNNDEQWLNMIHSGLADEYLRRLDQMLDRKFGRGKRNAAARAEAESRYGRFAHLYNFDLYRYIKSLLPIRNRLSIYPMHYDKSGYVTHGHLHLENLPQKRIDDILEPCHGQPAWWGIPSDFEKSYRNLYPDRISAENRTAYVFDWNSVSRAADLYWLFKYFGMSDGCSQMLELCSCGFESVAKWLLSQPPFTVQNGHVLSLIPPKYETKLSGDTMRDYRLNRVDFSPYFDRFSPEYGEKIDREAVKVQRLIKTLEG